MLKPTLKIAVSLIIAPIILLTLTLLDWDSESFGYIVSRLIPAAISSLFFLYFLNAYIHNKNLILYFTQKFYSKALSDEELKFLDKGDLYWVGVTLLNTIIQAFMGLYAANALWVFYSSVGWYIYFGIALGVQIVYGKVYALNGVVND